MIPGVQYKANISPCARYRYSLWRTWEDGRPPDYTVFVLLNPSTADSTVDDPTLRRCMGFVRRWNGNGLAVVNLFAWRATDPLELRSVPVGNRVGIYNNEAIQTVVNMPGVSRIICGWGTAHMKMARRRALDVMEILHERTTRNAPILCLGVTKHGHPKHPLYLPDAAEPFSYKLNTAV